MRTCVRRSLLFFFFNDTATTEIYTLSLHDALPISAERSVVTLNFEASSVLDMAWRPQGDRLSVSGNQVIKTWRREDWDEDPTELETGTASNSIAWSFDGNYLAAGNNDRSVLMWDDGDSDPWRMQGFPGKVRQLTWSMSTTFLGSPMLASTSSQSMAVWVQADDLSTGWEAKPLDIHKGTVTAIAFQPQTLLLASAAEDGLLCLWNNGVRLAQTLKNPSTEFSCLAWSPSGGAIAAGGSQGELLIWTKTTPAKGFG